MPKNIVNCLRKHKLKVRPKKNSTLDDVFQALDDGFPVLCPIQAYSHSYWYKTIWSGHWVIAIGYNDKHIFFEDSYVKRRRTFMTHNQFEMRWFDIDWEGRYYPQLSLTIAGEPKRAVNLRLAQRIW